MSKISNYKGCNVSTFYKEIGKDYMVLNRFIMILLAMKENKRDKQKFIMYKFLFLITMNPLFILLEPHIVWCIYEELNLGSEVEFLSQPLASLTRDKYMRKIQNYITVELDTLGETNFSEKRSVYAHLLFHKISMREKNLLVDYILQLVVYEIEMYKTELETYFTPEEIDIINKINKKDIQHFIEYITSPDTPYLTPSTLQFNRVHPIPQKQGFHIPIFEESRSDMYKKMYFDSSPQLFKDPKKLSSPRMTPIKKTLHKLGRGKSKKTKKYINNNRKRVKN